MNLTLKDRILLVGILPSEGSFDKLILVTDIKKKILITQDELKTYGITVDGNSTSWNDEGGKAKFDIEFTEAEQNLIAKTLKDMSATDKLNLDSLELYKLFVQ